METSKYAVVEAVLKVYDENARLRIENDRLRRFNADSAASAECESDPHAYIKARIMEFGRKVLVEKALDYWSRVTVRRNGDGSLDVETFDKWRTENTTKVPEFMSREDFYVLMDHELRAEYEKQKTKAMDELARAEREKDDDE